MKKILLYIILFISQSFTLLIPLHAQEQSENTNDKTNQLLFDIIKSIPAPIEVLTVAKQKNWSYNKSLTHNTLFAKKYYKSHKAALNFGLYFSDLNYAGLYERREPFIENINSSSYLANSLNIHKAFNQEYFYTSYTKVTNFKQGLDLCNQSFEKIQGNLYKSSRLDINILILTGTWIESMYLLSKSYAFHPNNIIRNKIGEQRMVLDKLLIVLSFYNKKPGFPEIIHHLKKLQTTYTDVKITSTYEVPTTKIQSGQLIIQDKSYHNITISDKTLNSISQQISDIRQLISIP